MATRLYLHNALFDTATWPGTYPDANTDTKIVIVAPFPSFDISGADAMSVHRSMNTTIGNAQASKAIVRAATTSTTQSSFIAKFISNPLVGVTSITAQTWTSHVAIKEDSANSNFSGVHFCLYVWRPSTNSMIGGQTIYDASGCGGFAEPGTANAETLLRGNFFSGAGRAIAGVQDGDVLIMEVFLRKTPATTATFTDTFYYDGATEYTGTASGSTVSDIASFIETPQNLTFQVPVSEIDMTNASTKAIADMGLIKV